MREEVRCAECMRKTRAGPLCQWCKAPLTWPPVALADDQPADPKRGVAVRIAVGTTLAAGAALLLTLNVVSGFLPTSSPDYESTGYVLGNVALLGSIIAVGVALVIRGMRRRRR